MSAAVWNEPQAQEAGRRDARRSAGGGSRHAGVVLILPAARRPAGDRLPRAGDPASAETA